MNPELYPEYPILIVDDEEHFLNSMKMTLQSNDMTNIECCKDSRKVMPQLKEKDGKYSLILLDIKMPFIDGVELLKQIVDIYKKTPVIMLTAVNDTEMVVNCIKIGATDYLVKPFDEPDLIKKIESVLENSKDYPEITYTNKQMSPILLLFFILLKISPKKVKNAINRRSCFGEVQNSQLNHREVP